MRLLPQRALAKKKTAKKAQKKTAAAPEIKLVPHIPLELVKETREFFRNETRFKALLQLVFSPLDPKENEQDRLELETAQADYENLAAKARSVYEMREKRANERMWRAIHQLPDDLYDEAVASRPEKVPETLLFHERYRSEIFNNLNAEELRKLQCFQNLMYLRFPHAQAKQKNPQQFWVPENQVVSRQKEAAMAKKRIKKRT